MKNGEGYLQKMGISTTLHPASGQDFHTVEHLGSMISREVFDHIMRVGYDKKNIKHLFYQRIYEMPITNEIYMGYFCRTSPRAERLTLCI